MPTPTTKAFRVGIICGSQRKPRCGDQISHFVLETVRNHSKSTNPDLQNDLFDFDFIDIHELDLPFYDEPGIPSKITPPEGYTHEHTRKWSQRISPLDAFIFVTPQYNWGYPAGLKNAIDYLFHEWNGKPAVIVSYGGHGGDKAAAALSVCLAGGLDMQVGDKMVVNLSFPNRDALYAAAQGKDLGLDARQKGGVWSKERQYITGAWNQMVGMLL
ncbi:flavoprotein-like protein [Penicillium maclennaniae]|uniref:flavoprotein-like protein n=1 Tax=Penicillium maclennaniae TaxID=1343394 RepID=UPI0025408F22|nr:flavoprotein-like protein [Penicillium maclennaniae]KAJ5677365.1 flavoprotein-like protein [Penicillium maclennaniae]